MTTLPAFAIGRWLAPAMAVFILGVVYLGSTPQYLTSAPRFGLGTVDLSRPNLGTAYASAAPSDHNIWMTRFEWTNTGQTLSTIPSLNR